MGIFDSFKNKAAELANKARNQAGGNKDQAGGAQGQDGGSQDTMSQGMQQGGDMTNKGVNVAQQRFGGADEAARTDADQQR